MGMEPRTQLKRTLFTVQCNLMAKTCSFGLELYFLTLGTDEDPCAAKEKWFIKMVSKAETTEAREKHCREERRDNVPHVRGKVITEVGNNRK